jgi:hypothetical protein
VDTRFESQAAWVWVLIFFNSALPGIVFSCGLPARVGWALGTSWSSGRYDLTYIDVAVGVAVVLLAAYLPVRRRRSISMAGSADSPR